LDARARFDRRIVVCRMPWLAEACRRVHHVTQSRTRPFVSFAYVAARRRET
jgi:hypothetical protein